LTPHFNTIYDSLYTEKGWRYVANGFADGTFTPVAGATINVSVNLAIAPNLALTQWPGAIHAYWVIRYFACAPQSAPATNGTLEVLFFDKSGFAPLGVYQASTGGQNSNDTIMQNPIADPDTLAVGTLAITLQPGGASPVVYTWHIGFGVAYLLPTSEPYAHESGDHHDLLNSHRH
jgi:hypothetical protein